ncbi:hypothetical protein CLOSTMETH_02200 [[Clostridium] methylpentosum DSM 5476]|uniref:Uncharacterized protein n=1 Tax=[Clostridium] methylpentosum DSM 5476 TaxID=537013 RepID=C0EEC0_9FIRM|nr:hypothetical protein CLOSTMETH_02200 [[Clostridium] methylpentosum DSM 5476]
MRERQFLRGKILLWIHVRFESSCMAGYGSGDCRGIYRCTVGLLTRFICTKIYQYLGHNTQDLLTFIIRFSMME